jgi:hypothetical protein
MAEASGKLQTVYAKTPIASGRGGDIMVLLMSTHSTPIDISNNPQLLRLAEEVEATNKPRLLKRDNTPIALLTPVKKKPSSQAKRKAIKETLALAGAWGDRDWNEVEAELDRIRHSSKPTPPFEL